MFFKLSILKFILVFLISQAVLANINKYEMPVELKVVDVYGVAHVRTGPTTKSSVKDIIEDGDTLAVFGEVKNWLYVIYYSKNNTPRNGWIYGKLLKSIGTKTFSLSQFKNTSLQEYLTRYQNVKLKTGPHSASITKQILAKEEYMIGIFEKNKWLFVITTNSGDTGWIHKANVKYLGPYTIDSNNSATNNQMLLVVMSLIFFVSLMVIFLRIKKYRRRKKLRTQLPIIKKAVGEFNEMVSRNRFINHRKLINWKQKYSQYEKVIVQPYQKYSLTSAEVSLIDNFKKILTNTAEIVTTKNQKFIESEKRRNKDLFQSIEQYPLNDEQQEAIIKDEDNNLVIASAGSGKTSTLIGKAIYLVKRLGIDPENILLLAFTRNASREIQQRLEDKLDVEFPVHTFHSVGLKIISEVNNEKPDLLFNGSAEKERRWIKDTFENFIYHDSRYKSKIIEYFSNYLSPTCPQEEFDNKGEYYRYLKHNKLETLNGEEVKSYQELQIANFFFENCIKYEYEKQYEYKTSNAQYRQYKPDFYLSDYGIYIEHFGVDENNNLPFSTDEENKKYIDGMKWKKRIHRKKKTTLICTYSYQFDENNTIFKDLEEELRAYGVNFQKKSEDELFLVINRKHKSDIRRNVDFLSTFITLAKSNHFNIVDLEQAIDDTYDNRYSRKRAKAFIQILQPIYDRYEEYLREEEKVDFSDMLYKSTKYVKSNQFNIPWKYILIDEFQDISIGRYNLVKAIIDHSDIIRTFCVGDDWQSIFRFTGSDVNVMKKFENYFGYTAKTFLSKSYRFTNKIAEFSSEFVMKNGAQIEKEIVGLVESEEEPYEIVNTIFDDPNLEIEEILRQLETNATQQETTFSVFILGRYSFDKPDNFGTLVSKYTNLDISFKTVHSSKGLEADYVILNKVVSGKYGFPSEIVDDPLINLVLSSPERYPFAEERRLFYVAITRSRYKVFILTNANHKSIFVHELEASDDNQKLCPDCKSGVLIAKSGRFGNFLGCDNYPYCDYTEKVLEERYESTGLNNLPF